MLDAWSHLPDLERLETLGVAALGGGTDRFPGFYRPDSGHPVDWRVDSPEEVAAVMRARAALGTDGAALVVANPVREEDALPADGHEQVEVLARPARVVDLDATLADTEWPIDPSPDGGPP